MATAGAATGNVPLGVSGLVVFGIGSALVIWDVNTTTKETSEKINETFNPLLDEIKKLEEMNKENEKNRCP
jgi:hypothetical protein